MKNSTRNSKKGFSLIELMVVVAIIGILTAIITANLAQSKSKARDAKRVSDIAQLQLALELYFDRCNTYPTVATVLGAPMPSLTGGCSSNTFALSDFISDIPTPPILLDYLYVLNGPATDYVLRAKLENAGGVLNGGDDLDGNPSGIMPNANDCDDTPSPNFYYCVQPR